jgi:hypothetical protein
LELVAGSFTRILLTGEFYPGNTPPVNEIIVFAGSTKISSGDWPTVIRKTKLRLETRRHEPVLIFDLISSRPVEIDFRGSISEVLARIKSGTDQTKPEPRHVGRPKLGVIAREVTLLPRHWDWLNAQPGGASVALRRLVEDARRASVPNDRKREAQESAYRFMTAMAGNETGYEDALRALYSNDPARLQQSVQTWPKDIRQHTLTLAHAAI